jgi:imidazolonepropionase-like amidohydrolase
MLMPRPVILLGCLLVATTAAAQGVAVRGGTVYPVSADPITDGVVLVQDGRITAVGAAGDVPIPDGWEVREAAVVVPGLIDARATVGLSGQYNVDHDQDVLERTEPVQAQLRALDAYNGRERLVAWVRSFGVTTVNTGHAPGQVVSGQTMVVKTSDRPLAETVLVETAAVTAFLGKPPRNFWQPRTTSTTRSMQVARLRQSLVDAQEYAAERARAADDDDLQPPARDLRLEALATVLAGETPLLVTANRAHDITGALRVADEFGITVWLSGAAEVQAVLDEVRAAGAPVVIHPTMKRAYGDHASFSFTTAAVLRAAGVPTVFQSGYESYVPKTRVVLFEAAMAIPYGLDPADALAMITLEPARLLGIDGRVGSLDAGKDADLALFDGDPFEYTTHCLATMIDGRWEWEGAR